MISWPVAVAFLGVLSAVCFFGWLRSRRVRDKDENGHKDREFGLEEKRFEAWRTMNYAGLAAQNDSARKYLQSGMFSGPPGGKVVSLHGRTMVPKATAVIDDPSGTTSPERMREVAELLDKTKGMSESEARAFLSQHGIDDIEIITPEGPPGA